MKLIRIPMKFRGQDSLAVFRDYGDRITVVHPREGKHGNLDATRSVFTSSEWMRAAREYTYAECDEVGVVTLEQFFYLFGES